LRRPERALIVGVLACTAGGMGAVDDPISRRLLTLAGQAGQEQPILRIGLAQGHALAVSAKRPYRLLDAATGLPVWKAEFAEPLQVVAEGGPREGLPSVYRVQVGAYGERAAAEAELERLARSTGSPGIVHYDADRGNWQVRIGRAGDRLDLNPLMERLREAGASGMWIAEEPAAAAGDVALRLVDGSYNSFPSGLARLIVAPARNDRIMLDGKPYRGVLELRVSPYGTVRAVNWVNLEQYLLGVVPAELGPEVWPELAALEAQAVAARTYAWRNRGQFSAEGFDLCDTPRCQVYLGADAEHPLSDRAVASTRGQVLTWNGQPIVALYTATCGGHTEDGKEIFPEHAEPYLRGVPCRAEADAMATLRAKIAGRSIAAVVDETGTDVTRDWALLVASGLAEADGGQAGPDQPLDAASLRSWTHKLAALSGLSGPSAAEPGAADTLARAVTTLLEDLGWTERATVLLSDEDCPALLRDPVAAALDLRERRALAYLVFLEALRPYPDGGFRPEGPATRARLAAAMVRIGESYRAFGLQTGIVSGVGEGSLRLIEGKGSVRLPIAPDAALFGLAGGRAVPAARLELWPGDRVQYRTSRGAIDFLELQPPVKGTADDRSAKVFSWEVRHSRRELEATLNRHVALGTLKDLEIVRRGVSGRIVELRVVGSQASTIVRGFDVRRLLDLRESLLVIEPQRNEAGEIEAVVFAGKGWGHGVGLCQVGAYGMALRGAGFRDILAHYYAGTRLDSLAVAAP